MPSLHDVKLFVYAAYVCIQRKDWRGNFISGASKEVLVIFAIGNPYKMYSPETGNFIFSKPERSDKNDMLWKADSKCDNSNQVINLEGLFLQMETPKMPPPGQTTTSNVEMIAHNPIVMKK